MIPLLLVILGFSVSRISAAEEPISAPERRLTEEGGLCSLKSDSASCCVRIGSAWKICLVIQLKLNELKTYAALTVNERIILLQELKVGQLCVHPVPGTTICLDIYWLSGSLLAQSLEVCSRITLITPAISPTFDLQCLSFKAGRFTLSGQHRPSTFELPQRALRSRK